MKKRIIILSLVVVGLLVTVTNAQPSTSIADRNINIDNDLKAELATKGLDTWVYADYVGEDEMFRCLISHEENDATSLAGLFDDGLRCSERFDTYREECASPSCNAVARIDYTKEEKDSILDKWEKRTMEQVAINIKHEREVIDIEKTREGSVSTNNVGVFK